MRKHLQWDAMRRETSQCTGTACTATAMKRQRSGSCNTTKWPCTALRWYSRSCAAARIHQCNATAMTTKRTALHSRVREQQRNRHAGQCTAIVSGVQDTGTTLHCIVNSKNKHAMGMGLPCSAQLGKDNCRRRATQRQLQRAAHAMAMHSHCTALAT